MTGSPPASLHIQSLDQCKYFAAAFRLWVTELRPRWIARWHGCAATHFQSDDAGDEDCVLLAELIVPVEAQSPGPWSVPDTEVAVNDSGRPYLLHLRMLQDWVTCGVHPHVANELKIRNVSGGGTIHIAAADELLLCDTTAGGILTLQLPPAAVYPGRVITFKRTTTGSQVKVLPAGTEHLDDKPFINLTAQFRCLQVTSGGKDVWYVITNQ